jgi:allantoin racemase
VRFLLYNPNSDAALTAELGRALQPFLQSGDSLEMATPPAGPRFIGSDETIGQARATMVEALSARATRTDAVILGCFGDLGVDELRRATARPILSLWDACWAEAALSGQRLAILTTSPFWVEQLQADIGRRGLAGSFPVLRTIEVPPSAGREQLLRACRAAIAQLAQRRDIDAVVLGGALLAVLVRDLQLDAKIRLFDTLAAAARIAGALAQAPYVFTASPSRRLN